MDLTCGMNLVLTHKLLKRINGINFTSASDSSVTFLAGKSFSRTAIGAVIAGTFFRSLGIIIVLVLNIVFSSN